MTAPSAHAPAAVEAYRLADDGRIPNNPDLPLLVYRRALDPDTPDLAGTFERAFAANGWHGAWRNGIFAHHHYHSTAHEALGIARGRAAVQFGGDAGPVVEVSAGDLVVLPAGTGHKRRDASPDLLVVGAYPRGQSYDMCTGASGERPAVLENIRRVPRPEADPIAGPRGPLIRHWGGDGGS